MIFLGHPEIQEVFRNLPGVCGSVLTKYQPVPSHQDPIHLRNYKNVNLVRPRSLIFPNAISVFVPLVCTLSGLDPSKKMRIERRHLQKRGYRGSISPGAPRRPWGMSAHRSGATLERNAKVPLKFQFDGVYLRVGITKYGKLQVK